MSEEPDFKWSEQFRLDLIDIIKSCGDGDCYLRYDKIDKCHIATNEWLVGTMAGRSFNGKSEALALIAMHKHLMGCRGHSKSIAGRSVDESGYPDLEKVREYLFPEGDTND